MNEQAKTTKWLEKYWKLVTGIILALAALGDAITGFQFLLAVFNNLFLLLNIPTWILVAIFLACLSVFIFYANKTKKLPRTVNYILISFAIFSGILFSAKYYINDPEKKFVIVYDDETLEPVVDLGNVKVEMQKIDNLFQLHTTGQLENAVFISTVSSPEIKWKTEFPNNTKLSSPIFSIQQVVDPSKMDNIIDISLSDFASEISVEVSRYKEEIRIFYEKGFEDASGQLKSEMSKSISAQNINEIKFDEKSIEKVLSKKATIIFLGSPKTFKNSIYNIDSKSYNVLIVPNWIRPNITPDLQNQTNRICVLSRTFDKLVSNDFETWKIIVDIIKDENFNTPNFTENIKTKIRSRFATNNQKFSTHF